MPKLTNVHDNFFKETFTKEENARDFLGLALPSRITDQLDLDTISIVSPTHTTEDEQEVVSDIVVKTTLKDRELPVEIYILFEHKSYKDKKRPDLDEKRVQERF